MRVSSLRFFVGGDKCNASCPYCVTKMSKHTKDPKMDWRRFDIACNYANRSGATTAILGGIGEPTLYPEWIDNVLTRLKKYDFPIIELQTNGVTISSESYNNHLREWLNAGLTTIQVSIVSSDSKTNGEVMRKPYYDLSELIKKLHELNFSVRLSCIMFKGCTDSPSKLEELINYSNKNKVDQLLLSPVIEPFDASGEVLNWVRDHKLSSDDINVITNYLETNGTKILKVTGGMTYDFMGNSVTLMDALTYDPLSENEKHLVLYPNGRMSYDRRFKGSVVL